MGGPAGGTTRGGGSTIRPGSNSAKDRVEARDHVLLAADHEAVAAFEAPDPSARAAVNVVERQLLEVGGARDVVLVEGVATVDHGVTLPEVAHQFIEGGLDDSRRQHQPDGPRCVELGDQRSEARTS